MGESRDQKPGNHKKIPVKVARSSHSRVEFNKSVRKLVRPIKQRWVRLSRKVRLGITLFLVILVVLIVIGFIVLKPNSTTQVKLADGTVLKSETTQTSSPDYKTITPSGTPIEQYGGWTRVSPADRDPAFAYLDRVEGTEIRVTQQPLPDDFKEDTIVQVEQLAQGYKANEKISVGDTTVYIGTSAKGPQSVIFSMDNLLILIKSSAKLTNDQWAHYITTLQ